MVFVLYYHSHRYLKIWSTNYLIMIDGKLNEAQTGKNGIGYKKLKKFFPMVHLFVVTL